MLDSSQFQLPFHSATTHHRLPLITDSFAGGGGASTGIELALGRSPDVAINHDATALSMHAANHPNTRHLINNVWAVDPRELVNPGQRVGLSWFSPDCKHHSKAKGGKPVEKNIRDLAWVVVEWARMVRPEIIMLENVEEFQDWGPLTPDNKPDKSKAGETFREWAKSLRKLGYKVEHRTLRACDYGAPTIRKRLFVIARRDGQPIIWPDPTHADPRAKDFGKTGLKPWRTAAEIIDWSIPCPSIFDTTEQIMKKHGLRAVRPLAENTLRRIARGIQKYVIEARDPFFVTYGQHGGANRSTMDPLHTVTASNKDQNCLVTPTLIQVGYGERKGQNPRALNLGHPIGTMVAGGTKHAIIAAFLAQHNTGVIGRPALAPLSTITTTGAQQNIVTAFMAKYYGQGEGQPCSTPVHTLTTRDRFGLVTVEIHGQTYAIIDIGMRMLTPREQFRAQGFPDSYRIDKDKDGNRITKTAQTRMVGNSVCPDLARALVAANCQHLKIERNS